MQATIITTWNILKRSYLRPSSLAALDVERNQLSEEDNKILEDRRDCS